MTSICYGSTKACRKTVISWLPQLKFRLVAIVFSMVCVGSYFCWTASAQRLPDIYPHIFSLGRGLDISTNQVFPGDNLDVQWSGYNNGTICIFDFFPCIEVFGSAYGPWQDGIFIFNGMTNRLLGTATFNGLLPVFGGYDLQRSFRIPSNLAPGVYGIEIQIDFLAGTTNGVVREQNELNNSDSLPGILRVLPPLSITGIRRLDERSVWLQLSGAVTQHVEIQVSKTMASNAWSTLTNLQGFRGAMEYWDNTATNPIRFYRVLTP